MSASNIDLSLLEDIVLGDLSGMDHGIQVEITTTPVQFQPQLFTSMYVKIPKKPNPISAVVKESIPLGNIPPSEKEAFAFFVRYIHEMARKLSYQLFEHDPRIGMRFHEDFPNSPLFDPPYVTTTFKEWNQQVRRRGYKDDMTEALAKCPFCNRYFTEVELFSVYPPVVWCGGNVGFSHTHCAPWVTPLKGP
jgi:hypothetical protein